MGEHTNAIIQEVYRAAEKLGARSDLLCILGSWGDTLEDADILSMLRDWNAIPEQRGSYHAALMSIRADLPKEDPGPAFEAGYGWKSEGNAEDCAQDLRDEALWEIAKKIDTALRIAKGDQSNG